MKYLNEYLDYLKKEGYTTEYQTILSGRLEAIDCYYGDNIIVLSVIETPEYSEYINSLEDESEYKVDYSKYIVVSADFTSTITTERNFFDGTAGSIYLVDNSEYHTHDLSLFKKCVELQKMGLVEHEKFILECHLKNIEWVNTVLAPVLKKCDYRIDYSSIFDIKFQRDNSNLTLIFKHYNESDYDCGITIETDCLTGELITHPEELKNKNKEEIWDTLVQYWKKQPLAEKYSYLYTEGKTKDYYKQYVTELEKIREEYCKSLKHESI